MIGRTAPKRLGAAVLALTLALGTSALAQSTTTTSAAGSSIPPAAQLVDANGAVWTVNAGVVYRNGAQAGFSANVVQLYWNGTAIFQENSAGGWWSWDGTTWVDATDPTVSTSAAGSSIPPAAQLVDANKGVWTVNAGVVYLNGAQAGFSANVIQLYWNGTAIFQENSAGGWWSWDGTTWVDATDPTVSTSAAGSSIPPAAQLVDANKGVWTVNAGVVYLNGAQAGFSANVVQLYWNGTAIYQQNSAGGWWSWDGTTWVDATDPTGATTGGTPPPTPATTPLPSGGATAVATFESLGLYWTPPSNPGSAGCEVIYRKASDSTFKRGLNMWFDTRNGECRGSLVMLAPNTSYEIQFGMPGQTPVAGIVANTWSEQFPISQTVFVSSSSQTLNITQGGTPSGYVLYTPAPGSSATIDVANNATNDITVSAPYVIIRGLTLKGAQSDAIDLLAGSHDVVIEDNDISGWGRFNYTNSAGWQIGVDEDSGIRCRNVLSVVRTVIQRNTIHDPRYGANSWSWGHPAGPQATSYDTCGGNHVFRYNTIFGSDQHYYNDGIGGSDNITDAGFPREDSDIYGNKISQTWDDAIEAEGRGKNIRIWGNYFDNTTTGVATTVVNTGPAYIFRNVYNRSRELSEVAPDSDDRNTFAKSGTDSGFGDGRRYVFHNTLLQAPPAPGSTYPSGAGAGLSGPPIMTNTVSRNNIFHIWKSWWTAVASNGGANNDVDYDLHNGSVDVSGGEVHGIVGTPIYQSGNGWQSESNGMYQLAPDSPGYDAGLVIPNFNDGFTGARPDMGAHEAGTPAMKFGVNGGTKEY